MSELEYLQIGSFFQALKAIHGPEFINATLRRHKKLALALQDFEKSYIIELESNLS